MTEAFKDKYTNEVSHSHQTKIALPTEVLGMESIHYENNWKWPISPWVLPIARHS